VDGKYEGFGIYWDGKGDVFYGEFADGTYNGIGIYICRDDYFEDGDDQPIHRSGTFLDGKGNGDSGRRTPPASATCPITRRASA